MEGAGNSREGFRGVVAERDDAPRTSRVPRPEVQAQGRHPRGLDQG